MRVLTGSPPGRRLDRQPTKEAQHLGAHRIATDDVELKSGVLDPEGAHLAALRRLADFRDRRVLELGCGEGRLTVGFAGEAAHVLAFDQDAEAVEKARAALPTELGGRVTYQAASAKELEVERHAFDIVLFSWSL